MYDFIIFTILNFFKQIDLEKKINEETKLDVPFMG